MAIQLPLNLPQFNEEYDGYKMRQLVDELHRLHAELVKPEDFGGEVITFDTGDATPSVAGGRLFKTTGTTAISDFDDGVEGQLIYVLATASITITDGAAIILGGSVNYAMTVTDTLVLGMFNDQVWSEVARSVN